jgi:hypothetical protein
MKFTKIPDFTLLPRYRYLVGFAFLLLFFVGGFFIWQTMDYGERGVQIPKGEEQKYWSERMQQVGANKAFDEFAASIQSMSQGLQHESAHLFGGWLYAQEGVAGLNVCDSRFDYGCFHEFLGTAIAELGLGSMNVLNQSCINNLGDNAAFCQHGVGHGIQSYFGYTKKDLFSSLETCNTLPANDPIGGCSGGIYMEYNFRTMLADKAELRPFTSIVDPCDEVAQKDLQSCIFWQPQWWHGVLGYGETAQVFGEMGQYCRDASRLLGISILDTCYRGIGNVTSLLEKSNKEEALRLCEAVSEEVVGIQVCQEQVETFF